MTDLVNLSTGDAAAIGLLGYLVVFLGLVLLMIVVFILGKIMMKSAKKAEAVSAAAEAPAKTMAPPAPGSAGELKLYDTDPRDAAMIMAIVADTMGKPLNELRFKSIREVEK